MLLGCWLIDWIEDIYNKHWDLGDGLSEIQVDYTFVMMIHPSDLHC